MTAPDQCAQSGASPPDPFDPEDSAAYAAWREAKLSHLPCPHQPLPINDPRRLSEEEKLALLSRCRRYNFAIYEFRQETAVGDKTAVFELGRQLGLVRLDANPCAGEDSISSIQLNSGRLHRAYIPYTQRPLNWHTDGYYNPVERRIRGFILHCVRDADSGGDTALLDPDLAYIGVRDSDPLALRALMHPLALTVPPNNSTGGAVRGAVSGPVFSVDPVSGCLHMRYTARTRSVIWRRDRSTRHAAELLREILHDSSSLVVRRHLLPGQGVVCNNVLHSRTGFADDANGRRLLYRARYHDRVADAEWYRHMEGSDALVE